MEISWIIIDGGDIFEGTPEMFADCFFSNVDEDNIRKWAEFHGFSVVIQRGTH